MADIYSDLLDATIRHVQLLQARGVRYAAVDRATLAALARPVASTHMSKPQAQAHALPPRSAPVPSLARTVLSQAENPAKPAVSSPSPVAPISISKLEAFKQLRERVLQCKKCANLVAARKNVVFGVGNLYADLMFVGEAPGADEDTQGEPFVGAAGQLLTKIIAAMGLRREDVYIANILKCRPDTPGQLSGNRKPTAQEMATCISHLQEQIELVRPKVLVALGATAVEGLLGSTTGITRLRGNWQTYQGLPLMPTYHPAYLLRNQTMASKRQVWEDMLKVMEKLGMSISERQRNFFK